MRKFITFVVVLIIQIAIIYGLYRLYVSYDTNSTGHSTSQKSTSGQPVKQERATPGKTAQASKSSLSQQKSVGKKITSTKAGVLTQATDHFKPLIYKNAVWGKIPSLKRSRMAQTGILVDINNRKVLWAKQSRKAVPIASMTKMMTVLLAFEAIDKKNNGVNLDTVIHVTNDAYKIGGSQVYLDPREKFPLKDLLRTIMIASANDSAYLVAQYLGGGDVGLFVQEMNRKAKALHMPNAHFSNPDGLPEQYSGEDNKATAEGLVFLAEHLLKYPLVEKWATTRLDYFRKNTKRPMMLVNTNHLVRDKFPGIIGMKTGYIRRAGYCLTAACRRHGQILIGVVTGFKSHKDRDQFMKNLLNWGFRKLASSKELG